MASVVISIIVIFIIIIFIVVIFVIVIICLIIMPSSFSFPSLISSRFIICCCNISISFSYKVGRAYILNPLRSTINPFSLASLFIFNRGFYWSCSIKVRTRTLVNFSRVKDNQFILIYVHLNTSIKFSLYLALTAFQISNFYPNSFNILYLEIAIKILYFCISNFEILRIYFYEMFCNFIPYFLLFSRILSDKINLMFLVISYIKFHLCNSQFLLFENPFHKISNFFIKLTFESCFIKTQS
ncbi:unnamed protein product [Moneuplotes crassus]|uniref:Uncharacterized protein n=1 Tax=Euplotes crassus TaxID=5936 RepID=A0AAD1ULA1_EUPCR|nr:unnamed protein product [Moneuplotes crassus]